MPGFNLKSYRDRFVSELEKAQLGSAPNSLSDSEIIGYIRAGLMRFNEDYDVAESRETANTAAQASHSLPEQVYGREINEVWIKTATGNRPYVLRPNSMREMMAKYDLDDTSDDTGDPTDWAIDPSDPRKIIIRPIPSAAVTNGLIFIFNSGDDYLGRIYQQTTHTATVTYNSTSVTINGGSGSSTPVNTYDMLDGDEFALILNANLAGTAPVQDAARMWFRIDGVSIGASSTTLTLARAYPFASVSAKTFVTAQVPELEKQYPGKIKFAPVFWGLYEYLAKSDQNMANVYRSMAEDEMSRIFQRDPFTRAINWAPAASPILGGKII